MDIRSIVDGITKLSADIAAGSGLAVLLAVAVALILGVYWAVLQKVAQETLTPWVKRRFLRLAVVTVLLIVAVRLQLPIAAALVILLWLAIEYLVARRGLPTDTAYMRAAQIAVPVALFALGAAADTWMRRSADDSTNVYLMVSFETDRPVSKDDLLFAWKEYGETLREAIDGVPGVAVRPDVLDQSMYERLDRGSRPKQALDEARRARADFMLINKVNIQEGGDAATRNFIGILGVYAVNDDGQPVEVVDLPRVEAKFSHVKYIALQTAWAFLSELKKNQLLGTLQLDEAAASRIKKNLLQSYLKFLAVEKEPPSDLQAKIKSLLALPMISDADVTMLLTSFVVPEAGSEHVKEEEALRQGFLEQLNIGG
jgi:hypothetical protein